MIVIDLNEIYKVIYYKYILSFKVLDITGVKHSQSFKIMSLKPKINKEHFSILTPILGG